MNYRLRKLVTLGLMLIALVGCAGEGQDTSTHNDEPNPNHIEQNIVQND